MADSNSKGTGKAYDIMMSDIFMFLENNSRGPIAESAVDLLKTINDLQQQVMDQKRWAQQKVSDAACRVTNDYFELQTLRGWKADQEKTGNEMKGSGKSVVQQFEEYVQHVQGQANMISEAVRRLDIENSQRKADTQALKLSGSESDRASDEVTKRTEKCMKKIADLEKQADNLRAQCEDEELRALEMERELILLEREAKEVEEKWQQKRKEKEEMLAIISHETKNAETQKAHSGAQLKKLLKQVKADTGLANDKCQRLKNELSHLRESHSRPIEELLPENLDFLYSYDEATFSESSVPRVELSHWICMICMRNEVLVLFLPCAHQVVCFLCYLKKGQEVVTCCPYCGVEIEDFVKVYSSSS